MNGCLGLQFEKIVEKGSEIKAYVDSDYAGNIDTIKSLTCFVFTPFGSVVSLKTNIQSVITLLIAEIEYFAMTEAMKEVMWLTGISSELGLFKRVITVYCDNQRIIYLVKNNVYHERSKHIDVMIYFVRNIISNGKIKLEKVPTKDNRSDMLSKALPTSKFRHCLNLINMKNC